MFDRNTLLMDIYTAAAVDAPLQEERDGQVECRYYVELEGAEAERGMKLLPRETSDISFLRLLLLVRLRLSLSFFMLTLFFYSTPSLNGGSKVERENRDNMLFNVYVYVRVYLPVCVCIKPSCIFNSKHSPCCGLCL